MYSKHLIVIFLLFTSFTFAQTKILRASLSTAPQTARVGDFTVQQSIGHMGIIGTVSEVVHATFSPDSNLRLGGNLHTNAFSTNWQSDTDGGSYLTNAIIAYNGVFYRNRTGTNTDTAPDGDATNWEATGGGDVVPLWKSNTNGGTYTTNDLVNYGGVLYKNLTGTNTDTAPDGDATNWTSIGGGAGGDGAFEYMVAKYSSSSFSVTNGMTFPYNTVLASEGSNITNTNGVFTLKAGSTYKLTADIGRLAGSGYVAWRWYNDTTNAWVDTSSTAQQWGSNYGASYTDSGSVFAIITPTVDTNVRVRQSSGTTSATQNTESTYGTARAFIEVMNVTNYSYGGTGLMIYDVNKSYILNDTIERGGLLYKANGNIPAGTTFAEGTTGATWTALTTIAPSSDPVWVASETISAGDIRVHNGIRYTNLTNTNTATNPNDDTLNWERSDQTYDRVLSPAKLQRARGTESITLGDNSTTSFSNVLFAGGGMNGSGTQYVFYLNQNGNAAKSGGGSWLSTSDERTKKDIKDFDSGLEDILKLRPVKFKYNGKYDTPTDEKEHVSFIAQEVEKVAPRMINRISIPGTNAVGENALKLLENSDFVPMLVNAVQELKQKNDALEARIKALESAMEPKQ